MHTWARRREYLCLQTLQAMLMKPAIASVTYSLKTKCRLLTQNCSRRPSLISYHCIIHQQVLCAKAGCGLQDTMKTVVESMNLIRARSLNHRNFQNHLAALEDAEFGDVLFYNSVRWLSRCAFLERFAALLPHIVSFIKEIDHPAF